jgi:uncharacterized MAPEG superfamily protein
VLSTNKLTMQAALSSFATGMAQAVSSVSGVLDKVAGTHVDIALASLLAGAVLCYVPHFIKVQRVIEASKYIPKEEQNGQIYQLKQPRLSLELALKHAPRPLANAIQRAQGAHQNLLEVYPFFAASVLAAKVAGVSSLKIDGAALTFLSLRAVYIVLYCYGSKGWMAYSRSAAWFNSLFTVAWLTWQAATNAGKTAGGKTSGFW